MRPRGRASSTAKEISNHFLCPRNLLVVFLVYTLTVAFSTSSGDHEVLAAGADSASACPKVLKLLVSSPTSLGSLECCGGATPCGSLEAALISAGDGARITLGPGIHRRVGNGPIQLGGSVPGRSITVAGPGSGESAVLDCKNGPCLRAECTPQSSNPAACTSAMTGKTAMVSLEGFTVLNGWSSDSGGCLSIHHLDLSLRRMKFDGCAATLSGGSISISNSSSTTFESVTIANSAVSGLNASTPTAGGGVALTASVANILNLVVTNATVQGTGEGGGISAVDSTLNVTRSRFQQCSSWNMGGGLSSRTSTVHIEGSSFFSCKASAGGGVSDTGSVLVTISDSSFTMCKTTKDFNELLPNYGGGADFSSTADVVISGTNFTECSSAEFYGAAGFHSTTGQIKLSGCNFDSNEASYGGGALGLEVAPGLEMENVKFLNNLAALDFGQGGAIFSLGAQSAVLRGCIFFNNSVLSSGPAGTSMGQGGAIFSQSNGIPVQMSIDDSHFESNTAGLGGAFNSDDGTFSFHRVVFRRNGMLASSGGAMWMAQGATFENVTFDHNLAHGTGGAFFSSASRSTPLIFKDCVFQNNACATDDGGAIYIELSTCETSISGCVFRNNSAPLSSGGAITSKGSSNIVTSSIFDHNLAGVKGGAIFAASSAVSTTASPTKFTISSCNFTKNSAFLGGGALTGDHNVTIDILGSRFENNNSTSGGAILLQEFSSLSFIGSSCSSNMAQTGGGCISMLGESTGFLRNARVSSNDGVNEGGAFRLSASASLTLKDSSLVDNSAAWGGVAWTEMTSKLASHNSTFSQNHAQFEGGVLYATHGSSIVLTSSTLHQNSAIRGAVIVMDSTATLSSSGSFFSNNSAQCIVIQGMSSVVDSSSTFFGNLAAGSNGGAIRVTEAGQLLLRGSKFFENVAVLGGAIFSEGTSKVTFGQVQFEGNDAQVGAAAAFSGSTIFAGSFSSFSGNNASSAGGGLAALQYSSGALSNLGFFQNYAVLGGAGLYVQRKRREEGLGNTSGLTIKSLSFGGNRALYTQGVAFLEASFDPLVRATCDMCEKKTAEDTIGTLPSRIRLDWPGFGGGEGESGKSVVTEDVKAAKEEEVFAAVESPVEGLKIIVQDALGNIVSQDNSSVAFVSPDARISGLLRATAVNGVIHLPPVSVKVSPWNAKSIRLAVTVSSPTNAFPDITSAFKISFCEGGSFFNNQTYQCQQCSVGSWCEPGQPMKPCPDGTFSFYPGAQDAASSCIACDDGSLDCQQGQLNVAYQAWLDPKSLNSTPTTYSCLVTNGCNGYTYSGPEDRQCLPGYDTNVPMCALCENDHFFLLQYCEKCSSVFKKVFPLLLVIVIAAWIAMNMLADTFSCIDIFLNEVQLLVMVASFNLNFPSEWVRRLVQLYNLAIFDPDVIGPECVVTYRFDHKFYVGLSIPLIGLAVYGILYLRHKYFGTAFAHVHSFRTKSMKKPALQRSVTRRRASNEYEDSIIHASLNWLDICYVSVMVRVFLIFQAQTVGDKRVMVAAPQIEWLSPIHIGLLVTSVFVTVVYIVGLPAFYAYTLFQAKRHETLTSTGFKAKFGWLTEQYTRRYFWWHLVNIALRVVHGAILVFGVSSPNVQVVIILPIQVLRIASQYKSSPLSSLSRDYLQSSLTLGQFFFTLGLVCYNYINQNAFSQLVFALSTILILSPTILVFVFEAVNKHLTVTNSRLLRRVWKIERKKKAGKFQQLDPYDIVEPKEICDWFRPHVLFALLLSKRVRERRLLMRVRDRFETCQLAGLGQVDWVYHLKKPQLYAVLSQALLGASAGHITVARVPRNGAFCKEHGTWHMGGEECSLAQKASEEEPQSAPPAAKPAVSWPPKLDRHVSWASGSGSGDAERERLAALAVQEADARVSSSSSSSGNDAGADEVVVVASAAEADSESGGSGNQSPGDPNGASSSSSTASPPEAAVGRGSTGPAAGQRKRLLKPPSIKVQNLVQWDKHTEMGEGMAIPEAEDGEEPEFVEAKMNMAELTLTFQRHLSMLVRAEKKKKPDSLRLVIRSEYIPTILSWLISPESTQEDQRLLRELVIAIREAAMEEAGGLEWSKGVSCFYRNRVALIKYNEASEIDESESMDCISMERS